MDKAKDNGLSHLGTHEDDVSVGPEPIDEDLHHLDQPLIGQDLQLLQEGFLTLC